MENENYKGISSAQEDQLQNNSQQPAEDEMDEDSAAKEKLTSTDPTKVVFLSANSEYTRKNGDAKVDIENVQRSVGMGKEELLKYANEPFWVRLRMTLFVLFWVLWLAMLIGSVAIIVIVPGCPASPRLQWWQKTTIYQVMVGSFKDSDGDKKGDLPGLTSKLDYFSNLKVDTLLLSPIFASAGPHAPSEVTNFTDVAHHYGNFTDFQTLIAKANEKNIKVILDFIPNHTSDKHPWFIKSANSEPPYTDFYIWENALKGTGQPGNPPNNWVNVDDGQPAWSWNPQRKQYYLHQFHPGLPNLNLKDPGLRKELQDVLLFWLNEGVDGFKVKDVEYLFEDKQPRDGTTGSGKQDVKRSYTINQAEKIELLREWRELFHNYTETSSEKHQRILLTEVANDVNKSSTKYFGETDSPVVDIPYYLSLTSLTHNSTPADLYFALENSFNSTPTGLWPNFVLGTSHHARLLSRVGSSLLDGIHMATLLSKGTPVVYFGDELGMEGGPSEKDQKGEDLDISSKFPMQWDNNTISADLGATNYVTVNAELEKPRSHLSIFKALLALREKPAISFGIMEFPVVNHQIFSMLRVKKGSPGYLVVVNFHGNDTVVDFTRSSNRLPEKADVELATPVTGFLKDTGSNNKVTLSSVHVGPHQSAVLTFVPKDK